MMFFGSMSRPTLSRLSTVSDVAALLRAARHAGTLYQGTMSRPALSTFALSCTMHDGDLQAPWVLLPRTLE
jgi:hypothetical protein